MKDYKLSEVRAICNRNDHDCSSCELSSRDLFLCATVCSLMKKPYLWLDLEVEHVDYSKASWFESYKGVHEHNPDCWWTFVFQKDNDIYVVKTDSRSHYIEPLEDKGVPVDSDLVIFISSHETKNCHNEVEHIYRDISFSDKALPAAFKAVGIDLTSKPDIKWGRTEGYQPVSADKYAQPKYQFILSDMSQWFYIDLEYFSTF